MMRWNLVLAVVAAGAVGVGAIAQVGPNGGGASTQPSRADSGATTRLTPADQLLNQMLRPAEAARRPLLPEAKGTLKDATSGKGATAPEAPELPLLREGTFVIDRTGRLVRANDGSGMFEFAFDSDGRALQDPPMLLLPNSRLEAMETQVAAWGKAIRFRVTGLVTTYRGRNGLLIERASQVPDAVQMDAP